MAEAQSGYAGILVQIVPLTRPVYDRVDVCTRAAFKAVVWMKPEPGPLVEDEVAFREASGKLFAKLCDHAGEFK